MFRQQTAVFIVALGSLALVPLGACEASADGPTAASAAALSCADSPDALSLPNGSCAPLGAETLARVRQAVVVPSGDAYVALADPQGGVLALRDANGDGVHETVKRFGPGGGTGMAYHDGILYFGQDTRVISWNLHMLPSGDLTPHLQPITIVTGTPADTKTLAIDADGRLLVDMSTAGTWRFSATAEWQSMKMGERVH